MKNNRRLKLSRTVEGEAEMDLSMKTQDGDFTCRAGALIIHENRLLVAKHRSYDSYYTVGGKIMLHETSCEAAMREAFEETGCRFAADRLAYMHERFFRHHNQRCHEITFYYLMRPLEALKIQEGSLTDQGGDETLHWLPLDQLPEKNLVPTFLRDRLPRFEGVVEHIVTKEPYVPQNFPTLRTAAQECTPS